jgi:hypothetical protein
MENTEIVTLKALVLNEVCPRCMDNRPAKGARYCKACTPKHRDAYLHPRELPRPKSSL